MGEAGINTLTMEQYLALTSGNQTPGVVKPEIRGSINFEIKSQLMRELRKDSFSGNKYDDANEQAERILDIVSLFNIPGVTHDSFMLCVFTITLTGAAKRWQLEEIHNFKQEGDETLYQAWERYNDLLYKCPTHDLNSHQKVNIFYKGLDTMTHQLLDSQGPIPNKTPAQALDAIQTMVRCETCEGAHLNKECLLHEEVKNVEEVKYGEFGRSFPNNGGNEARYCVGFDTKKSLHGRLDEETKEERTNMNIRNQNASLKNLETQIEQLAKDYQAKAANEVLLCVLQVLNL
ncbi:hypothetical protein Tco_0534310 [Tanacetum coccineum]